MTNNERTCELVKIVATNDSSKRLINDKVTYLFDKNTMTIYEPYAPYEMLKALGLEIVKVAERE